MTKPVSDPDRLSLLSTIETDAATEGVVAARSLILLRWMAMAGQALALLVGAYWFKLNLPLGGALAIVAAGIVLNIAAMVHYRIRSRLYTHEVTLYFAFDILQVSLLILLTGGLDNPLAVLLISPVALAAGMLRFWAVAVLTVLTICMLFLNAFWHLPLPWPNGTLDLPPLYGWVVFYALTMTVVFIATYAWNAARDSRRVRYALSIAQAELAGANQMTAMGALAAAVAHELGTPLATISLVSKELLSETPKNSPLRDDIELLVSQSERCRQVLADFARRPAAEGGDPYRILPLPAFIEEAAEPHRLIGINLVVAALGATTLPIMVRRRPELMHGLGNFLQNAFQFAKTLVQVRLQWDADKVSVIVEDDGPGYPPALLQKVGEPYISTRAGGGSHMGLGTFIAKTLLERTGAKVNFSNRPEGGARVTVTWPRRAAIFETVATPPSGTPAASLPGPSGS